MKKSKTIVCDVDDTISTHHNRDYENAEPHWPIIDKLNRLYDEGWEIIYLTARGQLSFNGDIELIEKYRRPVLEAWLHKHGVKYSKLSFQKELAQYYIDDKAIRPDEFLTMEMETLVGGSGAEVRREGNFVIKTAKNSAEVAAWYDYAANKFAVDLPEIHSIIGDTITMEYVKSSGRFCGEQLDTVLGYIEQFSKDKTHIPFNTYISRVKEHLDLCRHPRTEEIIVLLYQWELFMDTHKSFCHGDLTIGNTIVNGSFVHLIDPNPTRNVWTSYLLDYAKLYQSLHFNYDVMFMNQEEPLVSYADLASLLTKLGLHIPVLVLELTHWVRMIKYKEPKWHGLINDNINNILDELNATRTINAKEWLENARYPSLKWP